MPRLSLGMEEADLLLTNDIAWVRCYRRRVSKQLMAACSDYAHKHRILGLMRPEGAAWMVLKALHDHASESVSECYLDSIVNILRFDSCLWSKLLAG